MKKMIALFLCVVLLAAAFPATAMAAEINFVTAGTAGTFYAISVEVAKLWNDNIEGMHAVATPSGGGVDNLNQAKDGEAQIGIANANLVYQSMMGTDAFEGDANPDIRIFAGLYYNPNQVVVTNASGIDSFADFAGKHFSVGAAGFSKSTSYPISNAFMHGSKCLSSGVAIITASAILGRWKTSL